MAFLDKEGLERLWQHIVIKLGDKADKTEIEELKELPIAKGDKENSLEIAAGGITLSEGSIAGGQDEDGSLALAGCKGFFYIYDPEIPNTLGITTYQGNSRQWAAPFAANYYLNQWIGKKINLVGSHKHTMCAIVLSFRVEGTEDVYITVDKLPFGEQIPFDNDSDNKYKPVDWSTLINPDWDDGAIYCPEAPEAGVIPFGRGARSIGANTQAIGTYSVAEGKQTLAANDFGHAEGRWTKAGYASHAEGYSTSAIGQGAHSEGHNTTASAHSSHAEGRGSTASGNAAHAEGIGTQSSGEGAHAEGNATQATAGDSHAEGFGSQATASHAHAEGRNTKATGNSSHAEGQETEATKDGAHSEGFTTKATGLYSHAEGEKTEAIGNSSHSEGVSTKANKKGSHAEGYMTLADGEYAHTEGNNTIASGMYAHAEGLRNSGAKGAVGTASHVEGANGEANGNYSHVEGLNCKTKAGASGAHAEGEYAEANAKYSHSEGWHTVTDEQCSHVQGKYNKSKSGYAHVVGNGNENTPSDAHTLDWQGNAWFAGDVTIGTNSKKLATEEFVNEKVASAGGTSSNCPIKKGSGENTAILGIASEASASGRNGATIGGASFKGTSSAFYKNITLNGNVATYTGTALTTYWKVGEKVVFTNSYSSTSNGGPYSPLGEGTITAIDATAKTFTFDVTPPAGTTYVMLAAGNSNTHINSTVIGSGLTSVGNDSLVVGKNNTTRPDGLFVVGDGNNNSSKANAFEIYKSYSNSTYSYGLIKSGMYVGSANSDNLLQTAASVTSKIQQQVPGLMQPYLDDKLDKIIAVNKLGSGVDFNDFSITYNSIEEAQRQYKIQVIGDGTAYIYYNASIQDANGNSIYLSNIQTFQFEAGISIFPSLESIISGNFDDYSIQDFNYPIEVQFEDDGSYCDSITIAEDFKTVELDQFVTYPTKDNRQKVYIDMNQLANGPIALPKDAIVGGIFIEGEIEGEVYLEPIDVYENWNGSTHYVSSITITNENQTESIISVPWFDEASYCLTTANYGNTIPSFTGPGNVISDTIRYYYYTGTQETYSKSKVVTLEIEWDDPSIETSTFTLLGVE